MSIAIHNHFFIIILINVSIQQNAYFAMDIIHYMYYFIFMIIIIMYIVHIVIVYS